MKDIPRIHSLTTVGIRQHQEFDYVFHPFRTDFVGDSGCGKSLIADLLQLIFVGSEAFISGTESMDDREVDGMVLRSSEGRGTDMAYALLNIEQAPGQFIVLGAYLESTTRQSKSFVIHGSYDEKEPRLLERPIKTTDIVRNNVIPTLDDFKQLLEEQGFVYHAFGHRKKFHEFLAVQKLLSIDLSQNRQTLDDYAGIIRSFSRGKSLEVNDSKSLKAFLFGDEKAKDIVGKYKSAVAELQSTLNEYTRNRREIDLVTEKQKALLVLKQLKDDQDVKHRTWRLHYCAYTQQLEETSLDTLKDILTDSLAGQVHLQALSEIVIGQLSSQLSTQKAYTNAKQAAKEAYDIANEQLRLLKPYVELADQYGLDSIGLRGAYAGYHLHKKQKALVDRILPHITAPAALLLAQLNATDTLANIIAQIDAATGQLAELLAQQRILLEFAALNDEGSLGHWAIKNQRSFSLEAESIVMHYKKLPIDRQFLKPADDRYVPSPEELLATPGITDKDDEGFWLKTGAVREYIRYVPRQLFAAEHIDQLQQFLQDMQQDAKKEIETLEKQLATWHALKAVALEHPDLPAFLSLYPAIPAEINSFKADTKMEVSPEAFEKGLTLFDERASIESAASLALDNWEGQQKLADAYDRLVQVLTDVRQRLQNLTGQRWGVEVTGIIEQVKSILSLPKQEDIGLTDYLTSTFQKQADKGKWLTDMVKTNEMKIRTQDLIKSWSVYQDAVKEHKMADQEYGFAFGNRPDISAWDDLLVAEPAAEKNAYLLATGLYKRDFEDLVEKFVKDDGYKFETSQNYIELIATMLPETFRTESIEEDTAIEKIDQYLNNINEKNKSLNKRKLHKIRELLDEVIDEVNNRLNTVRQIHNFLNAEEREITGGHRVSLKADFATAIPKGWMDSYIEKLNDENSLFASEQSLDDLLGDSISLEEKMLSAFQIFNGSRATSPTVEALLDPNSYFQLFFKMESLATGKTNIGSTGQTYAAIALLCIARLSLVNKSNFSKIPPRGIRFMPIDEAEGLGSNFDMLYEIAKQYDYQILTMSINPLGRFRNGEQYIYMVSNNKEVPEDVNYKPYGIFSDADLLVKENHGPAEA